VVPTSRAGGHGGEAGTGSWERAGPSLLPWAAETSHKVVNTINGAAGQGSPVFVGRFWTVLPAPWNAGIVQLARRVFRSAVALARRTSPILRTLPAAVPPAR
jgi:hypothetical protein